MRVNVLGGRRIFNPKTTHEKTANHGKQKTTIFLTGMVQFGHCKKSHQKYLEGVRVVSKKSSITFNLPYPPSANRYWRIFQNRAVLSLDAKEFKATTAKISRAMGLESPTSDFLCSVEVLLHPRQTKRLEASRTVLDLDNCLKVALDAIQGVAYANDKQIREIHARYGEPLPDGGLTVTVKRIEC